MKKIITVALLAASFAAHAGNLCPQIEFAELQTYSDHDLADLSSKYINQMMKAIGTNNVQVNIEFENCKEQVARIQRIMASRKQVKEASK